MDIPNPRRILALGAPDSGVLSLLKDLTGSTPTPVDGSTTAGLSHTWQLKTQYYTAELGIWIDEVPDVGAWGEEFKKEEAREVVTAVGGWIFCFRKPVRQTELEAIKDTVRAIASVIKKACGYSWDGTCLAIAMPQSLTPHLPLSHEEWEDMCREHGFEYIDSEAKGRNEYGEPVGIARVKEALETTEWDAADGELGEDFDAEALEGFGNGGSEDWSAFGLEGAELNMELLGMKTSLNGSKALGEDDEDEETQVEELQRMMMRLQAVKDTSSAMPEEERKRFAAKAVNDIMKDL